MNTELFDKNDTLNIGDVIKITLDSYDWNFLYSKVEKYLFDNNIYNAIICKNQRTIFNNEAIIKVNIPQKGNKQEVEQLKKSKYCFQCTKMNVEGKRIFQFGIKANKI